ncbi:tyrosine-type recombinase/integrase [Mediterraneibacter gnavus]|uniref:tyrosine-type recombinase/integrase n=1 Tax=Mediterraneibacter gnavus TaxID=33038 RepID=UPI00046402F9|nr:tyrosine-type recombinase/integrase [Mediterraneibacter gnavus]
MAERSKRICLYNEETIKNINQETLKLFQKYQIDMSIRDLSENTVKQYNADLMQWFIYMHDNQFNLSVLDATEDDISEYYYWRKQQGNNVNRQKRIMSSISAFYKFLRKKRLIKESPVEFIDRPKQGLPIAIQTYLTKDQVQLMREKLEEYGDIQLQAYAFLSLTTMARVHAIASLKWDQVDFGERVCSDVLEKEGKIVELSFSEETKDYLLKLIEHRKENNIDDHGRIFISPYVTDDKPIQDGTLNSWCKKIGDLIGVPSLHPHDFRHSYATLMKNAGIDLESISEMLNHASVDVTKKFYIKSDSSKIRRLKDSVNI